MKLIIFLNLFFIPLYLFSQQTKEEIHQSIVNKYTKFKGIQIQFANKNLPEKSTIIATFGNKYSIQTSERTLYCDGESIWNVDTKKKSVVISSAKQNRNQFSIDEVFFTILRSYIPSTLNVIDRKQRRNSLTLVPKNSSSIIQNVSQITLDLTNKTINGIEIEANGQSDYFRIFSIKERKVQPKDYSFSPPNNYSVVDLRK